MWPQLVLSRRAHLDGRPESRGQIAQVSRATAYQCLLQRAEGLLHLCYDGRSLMEPHRVNRHRQRFFRTQRRWSLRFVRQESLLARLVVRQFCL
jgi:hypothetical protein